MRNDLEAALILCEDKTEEEGSIWVSGEAKWLGKVPLACSTEGQGSLSKGAPGYISGMGLSCSIVYNSATQRAQWGPSLDQNSVHHLSLWQEKIIVPELGEIRKTLQEGLADAPSLNKFGPISYPLTPVPLEPGNENECSK